MSYLALYRRYRPNDFATVYGQKSQIRSLQNAVAKQMVHHSYVFAGPRGTGKTSVARIFAKAVNCSNPKEGDCCNKCESCLLINGGKAIDVIEIDAASNNGVDEVRKLIEGVAYLPVALKKKVYIVDEAHMLTTSAWNALLKTLEEPPPYVIFIIATTEPHKIPLTILSRSQRYDFLRIADADLFNLLSSIADREKIAYEPAAISRIVALSQGGARDAIGVLDQLSLTHGKKLTEKQVVDSFNLVESDQVVSLALALLKADIATATAALDSFYELGKSLQSISNDLLSVLVEISLYDQQHAKDFAFVKNLASEHVLPLQSKAVAMAHRLVGFMTALRSFEIARHHYRLLALELTLSDEPQQLESVFKSQPASELKNRPLRAKEIVPKPTSPEIAEPPLPVLEKPLPAEYVAPAHVESAIELFPIELPVVNEPSKEKSQVQKTKKAGDIPLSALVPDPASSKLTPEELTLGVMYLNDQKLSESLQAKLQGLDQLFIDHPREAALYREGRVLVACPKGIVIMFEQESRATLFNEDIRKFNHELFVTTLFGASYRVVAVDRNKAKALGEKMMTMKKNNNAPSAVQILQEKSTATGDSAFDFAKELFGEGIKVV